MRQTSDRFTDVQMQTTVSEEAHSKNMWLIEATIHLNEWTRIVNDTPTHIWFSYPIFITNGLHHTNSAVIA